MISGKGVKEELRNNRSDGPGVVRRVEERKPNLIREVSSEENERKGES